MCTDESAATLSETGEVSLSSVEAHTRTRTNTDTHTSCDEGILLWFNGKTRKMENLAALYLKDSYYTSSLSTHSEGTLV